MTGYAFSFADDAAAAARDWLAALRSERRLSARTVEAYGRDLAQFAAFMADHLGAPVAIADLESLTVSDFRAFLARRRTGGAGSRTLARQLSSLRSFYRHGERQSRFRNAARNSPMPCPSPCRSRRRAGSHGRTRWPPTRRRSGSRRATRRC
jgi:site-specific recombinase XerC